MLRDIRKGDRQVRAVQQVISRAAADIMVLQGIDYDFNAAAVSALRDGVSDLGQDYPYLFALRPNSGWQSGIDLDGDGRIGGPRDAQGYGRFAGEGGMAILSRFPILTNEVVDFSRLLWAEQDWAEGPRAPGVVRAEAAGLQRLSSVGHWVVPVEMPGGGRITVLVFHATPPVFDGPEDRNGYRNADELRLWLAYLDGALGAPVSGPFVVAGDANADPVRGEGRKAALYAVLHDPRLQDPVPLSATGNTDTVFWKQTGPMRVDYILPASDLPVLGSGVMWPRPEDPFAPVVNQASRHRLVWVDIALPE